MTRNMRIYNILCRHHELSFGLLTRSTNPQLFDHKWAAYSKTTMRKPLICSDKGAPTRFRSQAEVALEATTRPICIR